MADLIKILEDCSLKPTIMTKIFSGMLELQVISVPQITKKFNSVLLEFTLKKQKRDEWFLSLQKMFKSTKSKVSLIVSNNKTGY